MSKKYTKIFPVFIIMICVILLAQLAQNIYAADVVAPSAVESLTLHSASKEQIVVKWSASDNFDKYELYLTDENNFVRTHIYDSKVTTAVLNDLLSNTRYFVKVRAYKNIQQKEYFNSTTQEWQLEQPATKDWANKRNRTVTVRVYGDYSPTLLALTKYDCKGKHTGGTATCVSRAKCEKCGEKYGQFSSHSLYFSGKSSDKKITNTNDINIAVEHKTYRCRYCKYIEEKTSQHTHNWALVKVDYDMENDDSCLQMIEYKCGTCQVVKHYQEIIKIDDKVRTDNTDAVANAEKMLDGQKKYMGIYANDVDVTLTKYKNGFNMIGWSEALDGKIRSDKKLSQCLDDEKLVPFINLLPNKCKLSDIAKGTYDHYLMNFFERVYSDTRTGTVFVCFAPEMDIRPNGASNLNDWQNANADIYVSAWQHVVEMGREYAPNIVWVWSPDVADKYTRAYYPGSEYVDCVSITLNDPTASDGTFEAYYKVKGTKKNLESYGKPIIISQAACGFTNQTKQKNYLTGMINYVQNDPAMIGCVIMDSDVNESKQYKFSDNGNTVYCLSVTLGKYLKYEIPTREVDWSKIDASYHKVVCNVQSQTGATGEDFIKWYNSLDNKKASEDADWSTIAISWAAQKAGIPETSIPIVDTTQELVDFYKAKKTFISGKNNCCPQPGDIVLFDDNKDKVPDRAGLVVYSGDLVSSFRLVYVGGNILDSETGEYVVSTVDLKNMTSSSNTIYGFCKLEDFGKKVEYNQYESVFKRNGVDCLLPMDKEKYAQILAADGIEVVARYINPDGRKPLTNYEVQVLSNYGIRSMMIYEYTADAPYEGYNKGYEIGTKALQYATEIGAPKGMPIFFCCDCSDRPLEHDKIAAFIKGVRDAMGDSYGVGMYGPYHTVQALYNAGLIDAMWQCYGSSSKYVSDDYDVFQWTGGTYFYDEIPDNFDADDVKNVEKVSFIFPYKELS